jgi:cysteine desulfurase
MSKIYLDHNASTPVHPDVIEAMTTHLKECVGNPSSVHAFGRDAKKALLQARDFVAQMFKVLAEEVIFCSSGTEGLNLILQGFCLEKKPGRILTSKCEHSAVYETMKLLEKRGWEVVWLPCGKEGAVHPDAVEAALKEPASLICLMGANNETGVLTDLEKIGKLADRFGVPFVVDAVALVGKAPFHIPKGVSAIVCSGQKIGGPKGIGFVICRRPFRFKPQILGGGQERGHRSGTENLPGIVGLQKALEIISEQGAEKIAEMEQLRNLFETTLKDNLPNVTVNGSGPRVSNTSNLCFHGVDGETLLFLLDQKGVLCSHGSACATGALEPSRILLEMGLELNEARSSLRFSIGYGTTKEEILQAAKIIIACVLNPV